MTYVFDRTAPGRTTVVTTAVAAVTLVMCDAVINPARTLTLEMLDEDSDGRIDTAVATFDEMLATCSSPCTNG